MYARLMSFRLPIRYADRSRKNAEKKPDINEATPTAISACPNSQGVGQISEATKAATRPMTRPMIPLMRDEAKLLVSFTVPS
jgi:hypothetical protein